MPKPKRRTNDLEARVASQDDRITDLEMHNSEHCITCRQAASRRALAVDAQRRDDEAKAKRAAFNRERAAAYEQHTMVRVMVAPTCSTISVVIGDGPDAIAIARIAGCTWLRPGASTTSVMPIELYEIKDEWIRRGGPARSDSDLVVDEISTEQFMRSPALQRRYSDLMGNS